jgi:hypothetical protein
MKEVAMKKWGSLWYIMVPQGHPWFGVKRSYRAWGGIIGRGQIEEFRVPFNGMWYFTVERQSEAEVLFEEAKTLMP